MSALYDCADAQQREAGILASVTTVKAGGLVVLPTDTVYGLGADAFSPDAVAALLAAKGRGRNMPPPVLVGTARRARLLGGSLRLAAPTPAMTKALRAAGLDMQLDIFPTVQSAIRSPAPA